MEVKKGYKRTEVGVIPEDWDVCNICALTSAVGDGIHATPAYSDNGSYFFVNGNNLFDGKIIMNQDTKRADVSEYKKYKKDLSDRTILLSINGTIGNLAMYSGEQLILGKSAAYLNINACISRNYIYFMLQSSNVRQFFENGLTGTTIKNLGLGTIRTTPIAIPTKIEQEAIAEALSDADALIQSLEKLIAKKRDIKQGAMQELLTPKEGWVTKKLGDICEIKRGQLITSNSITSGDIPVIAGGKSPAYYHNEPNRLGRTITISASGANAGYVAFYDSPIFASDCSTIEESEDYTIDFIYYVLCLKQQDIYFAQTGGAQPHIHPVDLYPIVVPDMDIGDQRAIATTLSDLDDEILALEAKLDKYRQIKRGMMQELLTGNIRLVNGAK